MSVNDCVTDTLFPFPTVKRFVAALTDPSLSFTSDNTTKRGLKISTGDAKCHSSAAGHTRFAGRRVSVCG